MTADQFTVYRCPECGSVRYHKRDSCPHDLTGSKEGIEFTEVGRWVSVVPVPVVPREDYDRLRAALEKIACLPHSYHGERLKHARELARSALHGEEA